MDSIRKRTSISVAVAAPGLAVPTIATDVPDVSPLELVGEDQAGWLPSFFIIGPPRTGTSWLYDVLRQHTTLPSPLKETRFFDQHFDRGLRWYRAHYERFPATRRAGEVAPTYFASSDASTRIARVIPAAKIVCVFRNPVERIVSLYRLKRAYGMIPWTFEQAITHDPELMETSRYASQLKIWQLAFGTDNVLATIYDDLRERPQSFVDSVADFIGIPRFVLGKSQLRRIHDSESLTHPRSYYRTRSATLMADWLKKRRLDRVVAAFNASSLRKLVVGGGPPFEDILCATAVRLYDALRPEVEEFEGMLNRDLSSWKFLDADQFNTIRAA